MDPYSLTLPFSEIVASPGAIDWVHIPKPLLSSIANRICFEQVEFDRYVLGGNIPMNGNM